MTEFAEERFSNGWAKATKLYAIPTNANQFLAIVITFLNVVNPFLNVMNPFLNAVITKLDDGFTMSLPGVSKLQNAEKRFSRK